MLYRIAAVASLTAALMGPPSIKVEPVANPATAPVKGAVFMLTARHHQDTDGVTVTGRAEGLVAGKRVTKTLVLTPAGSEGVYGVLRQWDAGQPWVLVFTLDAPSHKEDGFAEAAVRVGADGKVVGIDYPLGTIGANKTPWPRRVTPKEVDAALAAMAKP
jgi:hypothetical protein